MLSTSPVAVRLIKKRGEPEYGMLDFRNSPWFVKGRCEYENAEELIASIKENVIEPAEAKVKELRQRHQIGGMVAAIRLRLL